MTASKSDKNSVAERLRFNTNKTLDNHTYIKLYSKALDLHMEPDQRQSFFMIAKMLTDGTIALHKKHRRLADYYFELSERYISTIPSTQKDYLNFIENIYGRSKSFHYFKNGEVERALGVIEKCISATIDLEDKEGLKFLILDRISQHENLARVFFAKNDTIEGFKIISDCIVFLMTGKENKERAFSNTYLKENIPTYHEMKSELMINFIVDNLGSLQKEPDRDIFISSSLTILNPVFQNLDDMSCHTPIDSKINEFLKIIQHFYSNEILKFKKLAIPFINDSSTDKNDKLIKLTSDFFKYC